MKKQARPGWFAAWKVKLSRVSDAVMRSTFELIVFPGQLTRLRAVLIGYAVVLLVSLWLTAGLPGLATLTRGAATDKDPLVDILQKLASAYTPILVDIGIVIILGLVFMYRYAVTYRASVKRFQARAFERLASQVEHPPVVIPFRAGERIWVDLGGSHFGFDAALACTVQVSALSSDRLFHAVQGALDFAKLSLQGVSRDAAGLVLHLGSCAFRDLNIAHYWAFVPLSVESTDETNKRPRCMFDLLSPSQKRWSAALGEVVRGTQAATSRLPSFAPNPLGISVLLRVNVRGSIRWLMRRPCRLGGGGRRHVLRRRGRIDRRVPGLPGPGACGGAGADPPGVRGRSGGHPGRGHGGHARFPQDRVQAAGAGVPCRVQLPA